MDLTKDYYFAAYTQRNPGFAIQRVSLAPITDVTEIGAVLMAVAADKSKMEFSWDGEIGAAYMLESTDDLVDGTWTTVTNVWGHGKPIVISGNMEQTNAFYRVSVAE